MCARWVVRSFVRSRSLASSKHVIPECCVNEESKHTAPHVVAEGRFESPLGFGFGAYSRESGYVLCL